MSIRNHPRLRDCARWLRMLFVRRVYGLRGVHKTFYLGGPGDIAKDFRAGEHSYVGRDACICPRVSIGKYVLIAHEVSIQGGDHRYDIPGTPICFSGRPGLPETIIEDDVWIGHRAIILAGVRIGRGAIVAAGTVVTRDVEPYAIVAGVPACKVKERFPDPADRMKHDDMLGQAAFNGPLVGARVPGAWPH